MNTPNSDTNAPIEEKTSRLTATEVNISSNIPVWKLLDELQRKLPDVFWNIELEYFIRSFEVIASNDDKMEQLSSMIAGIFTENGSSNIYEIFAEWIAQAKLNNDRKEFWRKIIKLLDLNENQ